MARTKRSRHPNDAEDPSASERKRNHVDESLILIPQRKNEFSENTWWMVDLSPIGETTSQGASALVKRCMRTHGWDETKARKVLAAYRQFLILKKEYEDWEAQLFSPCYLVDQMWHCHILDVVNYCHDMMLLCGQVVGHNPDGALDVEAKQKRDKATRNCLAGFASYDEEVWDYSPGVANEDTENSKSAVGEKLEDASNEDEERETASSDGPITIRVIDQEGEETMFKIKRTTQLKEVFNAYANKKGIDRISLNFLLDGERMYDGTPESWELEDNDQIFCILQQCGC